MRIMTRKEAEVLDKLLQLAGGDVALVEEAFRASIRDKEHPDLTDVVDYIAQKLDVPPLD